MQDFELKPLKYPGDPDPAQNITRCPYCNGSISEKDGVPFCHNCNKIVDGIKGNPYQRKVPDAGERYKDFGPKDTILNPRIPLQRAASQDDLKRNKTDEDMAEHSDDTVKEVFISDTIHQCLDPRRNNRKNVDVKKEDVMRSCEDLAIDG